jgi:hypothetical protein
MDNQRFLNSYHNASTPPGPDVPADLAGFMLAADPVLGEAAELSRVLAYAHQGTGTLVILDDCSYLSVATAVRYFEVNTGWEPEPIVWPTRLRAFRLPDPRTEPGFTTFRPFGLGARATGRWRQA